MDNTNFSFEKFNEIEKEYNNSLITEIQRI